MASARKAEKESKPKPVEPGMDEDYDKVLENQCKIREMCDNGEEGI